MTGGAIRSTRNGAGSAPIVAVTGGTGFLGSHVVAALSQAGWHVRLLARRNPMHPLLSSCRVESVPGDLDDAPALARLVEGASAVVHVAALVAARSRAAFMATNRDGTARLATIVARDAPDARFVLVSSQAARAPDLSDYAASKQAAEAVLAGGLPPDRWVVVRPCVTYGPWDLQGTALLRLAQRRVVPVPRRPQPRIAMIHARDAAGCIAALCRPGPSGVLYELSDRQLDGHPWREIVRMAARPSRPRFLAVPDAAFLSAGLAADACAALTGRPLLFGRGKVREILHRDWSIDPARRPPPDLWQPSIDLVQGMTETVDWWRGRS